MNSVNSKPTKSGQGPNPFNSLELDTEVIGLFSFALGQSYGLTQNNSLHPQQPLNLLSWSERSD